MRFELVWYRFFPNFWIGVLASCPAQAEARKPYLRPLRPKLRSGGTFSSKHQKKAILAKSRIFSRKLRLWMSLRGGLLGNTLVAMPQGLNIQKICIQNWKQAKNQDSGLLLKISRQVDETLEMLGFFCSGASSDLKIWLFKQKKYANFFFNWT